MSSETLGSAYGWLSVLPPLVAIGLALVSRQVILSLLAGIWLGVTILHGWNPVSAFLELADTHLVDAVADRDHAAILLFSLCLGGMVGILARSGAADGVVAALAGRIRTRRGGQLTTAALGTAIFFDDYANTLLVGNTMRPLTDRLRISREKLAWLVDSTAAPVATLAIVSTWIGFEVGLIQDAMVRLGLEGSGYLFFLRALPYNFYPVMALALVFMIAGTGRDFGPMARAERRAMTTGAVLRPGAQPASAAETLESQVTAPAPAWTAAVPVGFVVVATIAGLLWSGRSALLAEGRALTDLRAVVNAADSLAVLMWASVGGSLVAGAICASRRELSVQQTVGAWVEGVRAMAIATIILVLAWALGGVCEALGTGDWLVGTVRDALSPRWLPTATFLLASLVSFATGTSWGTMAILIPIVFPLATALPEAGGVGAAAAEAILASSVSAVLAGSVFGDHCSPISDTTIMSSMASGADHVDHVRTQFPYAGAAAGTAIATGYLPAGWGVNPWLSLALGVAVLALLVFALGRKPPAPGEAG